MCTLDAEDGLLKQKINERCLHTCTMYVLYSLFPTNELLHGMTRCGWFRYFAPWLWQAWTTHQLIYLSRDDHCLLCWCRACSTQWNQCFMKICYFCSALIDVLQANISEWHLHSTSSHTSSQTYTYFQITSIVLWK